MSYQTTTRGHLTLNKKNTRLEAQQLSSVIVIIEIYDLLIWDDNFYELVSKSRN